MKVSAVIPARLESTRLPEKVLADIGGQSMIQRVYSQAMNSKLFDHVIIATDSEKVMAHCITNNMRAMITSDLHESGTDRVAEVASIIDTDIIINIQGDEPFIEISALEAIVQLMKNDDVHIGTLTKRIKDIESLLDYNVVKLVKDINQKVLYFSRQAIPAQRDVPYREWLEKDTYYQHLGLYGFKKDILLEITSLPQAELEKSEKLEQLRWMSNGYPVHVAEVESQSFGIDSPADLEKARKLV